MESSHQGRLLDPTGAPVNGAVTLTVAVWDAASGGTQVHTETFPELLVDDGHYAVTLGAIGTLEAHELDGARWLSVSWNGSEFLPRTPLQVVPHAAVAYRAAQSASAPFPCDTAEEEGALYYDTTRGRIRFCGPGGWLDLSATAEPLGTGDGTAANPGTNCHQLIVDDPSRPSGTYWVDPDGPTVGEGPIEVYCDMTSFGGGWTLAAVVLGTSHAHKNGDAIGTVTDPALPPAATSKLADTTIQSLRRPTTGARSYRLDCLGNTGVLTVFFNADRSFNATAQFEDANNSCSSQPDTGWQNATPYSTHVGLNSYATSCGYALYGYDGQPGIYCDIDGGAYARHGRLWVR